MKQILLPSILEKLIIKNSILFSSPKYSEKINYNKNKDFELKKPYSTFGGSDEMF